MIIFDEKQYCNELLAHGFPTRFSKRDIIILAKKYRADGFNDEQIYDKIVAFCRKWCKKFVELKYQSVILDSVAISAQPSAAKIRRDTIKFSRTELDRLATLGEKQADLLFVMMCVCKMYGRTDLWINSKSKIKLSDLCELAKLNLTNVRQEKLVYDLIIAGAIEQAFPNLLHLKLAWLDDNPKEIWFSPSKLLIYNWHTWYDKNYTRCEVCGKLVVKTNNKVKYCSECAFQVAAEQRREYNAKHRQK